MTIEHVLRLAAAQHGAVTVRQAQRAGATRREIEHRIATKEWERRHASVLVMGGRAPSWLTELHAATLARSGAMGSHRSAGKLHHLEGFVTPPVEITVPRGRLPVLEGVVVHRTTRLAAVDITTVAGIPTTSLVRTLCDLGAVVDMDRLERATDSALRAGLDPKTLTEGVQRLLRPGPSGAHALARVLALPHRQSDVPATTFERLLRALVDAPQLPPAVPEHTLRRADGRVVARFDVAFPVVRLGVEAHSDAWHFGARRGEKDRRRDRAASELQWDVAYLSWAEVHDPAEAVASLRAVCQARAALLGVDPVTWRPLPAA